MLFCVICFFFMDTATTDIDTYGHTLSLHDALPIFDDALRARAIEPARARPGIDVVPTLPLHRLQARLGRLGIDSAAYAERTGLALVAEPAWLAFAGPDRFGRALWLQDRKSTRLNSSH